jgi:hypothetical protein
MMRKAYYNAEPGRNDGVVVGDQTRSARIPHGDVVTRPPGGRKKN